MSIIFWYLSMDLWRSCRNRVSSRSTLSRVSRLMRLTNDRNFPAPSRNDFDRLKPETAGYSYRLGLTWDEGYLLRAHWVLQVIFLIRKCVFDVLARSFTPPCPALNQASARIKRTPVSVKASWSDNDHETKLSVKWGRIQWRHFTFGKRRAKRLWWKLLLFS